MFFFSLYLMKDPLTITFHREFFDVTEGCNIDSGSKPCGLGTNEMRSPQLNSMKWKWVGNSAQKSLWTYLCEFRGSSTPTTILYRLGYVTGLQRFLEGSWIHRQPIVASDAPTNATFDAGRFPSTSPGRLDCGESKILKYKYRRNYFILGFCEFLWVGINFVPPGVLHLALGRLLATACVIIAALGDWCSIDFLHRCISICSFFHSFFMCLHLCLSLCIIVFIHHLHVWRPCLCQYQQAYWCVPRWQTNIRFVLADFVCSGFLVVHCLSSFPSIILQPAEFFSWHPSICDSIWIPKKFRGKWAPTAQGFYFP